MIDDETGLEMTEKDILKEALELMSEVLGLLFETKTTAGNSAGFMADSLIKYLQVIYRDDDILLASADYTAYEEEVSARKRKHLEVIK